MLSVHDVILPHDGLNVLDMTSSATPSCTKAEPHRGETSKAEQHRGAARYCTAIKREKKRLRTSKAEAQHKHTGAAQALLENMPQLRLLYHTCNTLVQP